MTFTSLILNLQRLLLGICGLSFLILAGLVLWTDPNVSDIYFISFLVDLFVFLSSSFCLFGFWVTFSKKYVDLTNIRVTTIIRQSVLASTLICTSLFLIAVGQLNFLSLGLLLFGYILIQIWAI